MERILRRNINKYLKSIKRNMILVNRETKIFLRNLKEEIGLNGFREGSSERYQIRGSCESSAPGLTDGLQMREKEKCER